MQRSQDEACGTARSGRACWLRSVQEGCPETGHAVGTHRCARSRHAGRAVSIHQVQPGPQSSWGLGLGVTVGVGCGMCVPGPSPKRSVKPGLRPWPFGEHTEPAPHLTRGQPGGCRAQHLRQQSHRQPRLVEVRVSASLPRGPPPSGGIAPPSQIMGLACVAPACGCRQRRGLALQGDGSGSSPEKRTAGLVPAPPCTRSERRAHRRALRPVREGGGA